MMQPFEMPNEMGVMLDTTVIPAVNIQVDNMPGYIADDDCEHKHYFPLYWETPFEDGSLWVVEYWGDDDSMVTCHAACQDMAIARNNKIHVQVHHRWAHDSNPFDYDSMYCESWDEFLAEYRLKVKRMKWSA